MYVFPAQFDSRGEERQVWYSHGCIGEPVFIPRLGYRSSRAGDEDDGFVIVQLYVPEKHVTEFCLLDAKDLGSGPLARVKLKHHVPYGFHGTFTPEVFTSVPVVMSKLWFPQRFSCGNFTNAGCVFGSCSISRRILEHWLTRQYGKQTNNSANAKNNRAATGREGSEKGPSHNCHRGNLLEKGLLITATEGTY